MAKIKRQQVIAEEQLPTVEPMRVASVRKMKYKPIPRFKSGCKNC